MKIMPDPLFHSEPHMTPAQLAEITGLSPDMQRDWRRRGYIAEKIGTLQQNGRWLYDWADALFLCTMQRLYNSGLELPLASRCAGSMSSYVMFCAMHNWNIYSHPRRHRFFLTFKSAAAEGDTYGGWATKPISDLSQVEDHAAAILVDAETISRSLPEEFEPVMLKGMEITLRLLAEENANG